MVLIYDLYNIFIYLYSLINFFFFSCVLDFFQDNETILYCNDIQSKIREIHLQLNTKLLRDTPGLLTIRILVDFCQTGKINK